MMINNDIIKLTQKEYEVLIYFINHQKMVLSREQVFLSNLGIRLRRGYAGCGYHH